MAPLDAWGSARANHGERATTNHIERCNEILISLVVWICSKDKQQVKFGKRQMEVITYDSAAPALNLARTLGISPSSSHPDLPIDVGIASKVGPGVDRLQLFMNNTQRLPARSLHSSCC